jgi:CBS domain-containing protein
VPVDGSGPRIAAAAHAAEGRTPPNGRAGCPFPGSSRAPRLEQVAARLQDKDLSALVILDGYRLVGIITERDIVRAVADRRDLAAFTAGDYMTPEPARDLLEVESATTG